MKITCPATDARFVARGSNVSRVSAILLCFLIVSAAPRAADWPQWRGPNRDGISSETGLLAAWPPAGPRLVWRATGLGEGYASIAVARGRLYTQGQRGSQQFVMAFDVKTGGKLWETPTSARSFRESRGNGPRGTPTIDGDRLYAMAADGTLASLDAATGKVIWSQNVVQKYRGAMIEWAFSESPLVDGDRLIVMPGGPGASLVSLNKLDGTLQWKAGNDQAGYSSTVLTEVEGVRQVVALSGESAFGVRVDNGQVLWRYDRVSNSTANIATPIVHDGHVFLSTDYGTGGALLRLGARGASEVYFTREMMNHYSTSVLVGDVLYGFSNSILTAMRFRTGQVLWRHRSVGKGSLVFADKFLYVLSEEGVLGLVEARPDQYREVSRFEIPSGQFPTWAPPTVADGRLYVREQDRLMCFDIGAR
jgi:outer membrane protein assembly factor BamB